MRKIMSVSLVVGPALGLASAFMRADAVGFLVTSASGVGQDADKDLGNFQGRWTVIRAERDGKPEPVKVLETLRVTISGGEVLMTGSDGEVIRVAEDAAAVRRGGGETRRR
jgi:hypothetical protein